MTVRPVHISPYSFSVLLTFKLILTETVALADDYDYIELNVLDAADYRIHVHVYTCTHAVN